jgi:hypothetical protein
MLVKLTEINIQIVFPQAEIIKPERILKIDFKLKSNTTKDNKAG